MALEGALKESYLPLGYPGYCFLRSIADSFSAAPIKGSCGGKKTEAGLLTPVA